MTLRPSLCIAWIVAALAAQHGGALAGEADAAKMAGDYCAQGLREVGSCLRLAPDGKFKYFLSYGAYDENSEGTWRLDGGSVVLESLPYDRQPRFIFKGASRSWFSNTFAVSVVGSDGQPVRGVYVGLTCDGRTVDAGTTGMGELISECTGPITAVLLGLPMFGLAPQTIDVSSATSGGKSYAFTFEPGDLGKRRFAATRLKVEGTRALLMPTANSPFNERAGETVKYQRE